MLELEGQSGSGGALKFLESEFKDLIWNIRQGARIVLFRKSAIDSVRVSVHQIVLLAAVDLVLMAISGWLAALPNPEFNPWGLSYFSFGLALLFAIAYLFAVLQGNAALISRFVVSVYSTAPLFYVIAYLFKQSYAVFQQTPWVVTALWWGYVAWFFLVAGLILMKLATRKRWRVALPLAAYFTVAMMTTGLRAEFFYPGFDADSGPKRVKINQEEVYDAQRDLVWNTVEKIKRGRPGVPEVYFLGFAGFSSQDVFKKEVLFARNLFDRQFGTRGRSLVMINHADTATQTPMANASNLRRTLNALAKRMNKNEDVLFMYMTSHGSRKRGLSVEFWPLSLNDIAPNKLKTLLDEAGIKWRILLISACYSGTFVDTLKDEHTLVMTASASDKQSFGCSNTRDFTYFGEALFKDSLSKEHRFIPAFKKAIVSINERETKERKQPSTPQLHIGAKIAKKLSEIEQTLKAKPSVQSATPTTTLNPRKTAKGS